MAPHPREGTVYHARPGSLDEHIQAAGMAAMEGRWRAVADAYKKGYEASGGPDKGRKWGLRFCALRGYCSVLKESHPGFQTTKDDIDFLKRVGKDKKEPVINRSQALVSAGLARWTLGDRDGAARNYRSAIEAVDTPEGASEAAEMTVALPGPGKYTYQRAAPELAEIRSMAADNLRALERGGGRSGAGRVPGDLPPVRKVYVADGGDPSRLDVRGARCDRCGKEPSELAPGGKLKACAKCAKAYYCSPECQKAHWREGGHREWCRPKGELRVGDEAQLMGLVARPELNGAVVRLVAAPDAGGERWTVRLEGPGGSELAIKPANINLLLGT